MQLLQAATCLNPNSVDNLKQVGKSLYLLGRHKAALDVYKEALRIEGEDWEVWHNQGLCHMYLKQYDKAVDCLKQANTIQLHDATFIQLGKVYTLQENFQGAIDTYLEALEFSPDNPEMLTTVGLLYLRIGENYRAFDYLGNSLTHDPRNAKTILAAGSIIQDHSDMDVALVKYRVAAVLTPNSAQLWNNIGMCFFGKQRYVAAIACLKRALYLDPFEWIISYNLGLVHLNTGQYASAFHFFSSSINLNSKFPSSYMYLAITLARLDDFENACSAYDKAIELEECVLMPYPVLAGRGEVRAELFFAFPAGRDHLFELNYAITLFNNGDADGCRRHFGRFEALFEQLDEDSKGADADVLKQREALRSALAGGALS